MTGVPHQGRQECLDKAKLDLCTRCTSKPGVTNSLISCGCYAWLCQKCAIATDSWTTIYGTYHAALYRRLYELGHLDASGCSRCVCQPLDLRAYRYTLTRDLGQLFPKKGTIVFVMLNPSTADQFQDDPTIRRCRGFATDWGFARLEVVNLYALRATNPKALFEANDPVGPANNDVILAAQERAERVVVAWGAPKAPQKSQRVQEVVSGPLRDVPLFCLGTTKDGAPRHPLYVPKAQGLVPWLPPKEDSCSAS